MCNLSAGIAAKARETGFNDGLSEGRVSGILTSIHSLMQNMKMTAEQAMAALNVAGDEYEKYKKLLAGMNN